MMRRPDGFHIPTGQNFLLFAAVAYLVYATALPSQVGAAFAFYLAIAALAHFIGLFVDVYKESA